MTNVTAMQPQPQRSFALTPQTLDEAITAAVKEQAAARGYTFDK